MSILRSSARHSIVAHFASGDRALLQAKVERTLIRATFCGSLRDALLDARRGTVTNRDTIFVYALNIKI